MDCPNCGKELNHTDSYGNRAYISYGDQSGKVGDIYECSNSDGFEDEEEALAYLDGINETLVNLGLESLQELTCDNGFGNRHYYTDKSGDLKSGYPC
jgi:hypothetical protein